MWGELALPILVTVVILGLPGLAMGAALGLRGTWLAAAAAPLSMSAVVTAAIVAEKLGVEWSIVPVVVVSVAATLVLLVLRRVYLGGSPVDRSTAAAWWPVAAGVAIAAGLIGRRLGVILQEPDAVSQSYDNIFHLNGIRYVLETGSASPLTLGEMTSPEGNLGFYPSGWHALNSLVVQVADVEIAVAVNAVTIVVAALVWPISIVLLARTWFGTGWLLSVSAGVFAAACGAFPFLLIHYGVLYPLFLGFALLPVALAALAVVLGLGDGPLSVRTAAVALLGIVPGMAVSHPGALVALIAFSAPLACLVAVRRRQERPGDRPVLVLAVLGAYLLAVVVAFRVLRPPSAEIMWPTIETSGQAVGEVLTGSVYGAPLAAALTVALALGVVFAVRERRPSSLAPVGVYATAGVLFVVVASVGDDTLRTFLTGPWYNNPPRLAALLPLAYVPLAAFGVERGVAAVLARQGDRLPATRRPLVAICAGVVGVGLLIGSTHLLRPLQPITAAAQRNFALVDDAWLVTPDEVALMERLDAEVPEDSVVAGNPWTGAGLALAYGERDVLMPHLLMDIDDDTKTINADLRRARPGSEVCSALERKHVDFVLDFGDVQVNNKGMRYPGLEDLADSDAVELVDSQGDARLYRIVGC